MPSEEAKREARRALERRLVQERVLFAASFSAFVVALYLNVSGAGWLEPALYALIAASAVTGAGLDGAREGLKDIDLLAALLDHEGTGSRIVRVPFWSRGHYEVWFETPVPGGTKRFGLSFANSLLARERGSRYMFMFPVTPGKHVLDDVRPKESYKQTGTGGVLEGKSMEWMLGGPARERGLVWRLVLFVSPGRPMDEAGAIELRGRGDAMAAAIAKKGASAVPWGTSERFRPQTAQEIPEGSRIRLGETKP